MKDVLKNNIFIHMLEKGTIEAEKGIEIPAGMRISTKGSQLRLLFF